MQTDSRRKIERGVSGCGSLLHIRHKAGQEVPVLAKITVLRDRLGERIGTGVLFHPAETLDALPHGQPNSMFGESLSEIEERLDGLYRDFQQGEAPLGVMWVMVDQARAG
jgi:hypothetical protein